MDSKGPATPPEGPDVQQENADVSTLVQQETANVSTLVQQETAHVSTLGQEPVPTEASASHDDGGMAGSASDGRGEEDVAITQADASDNMVVNDDGASTGPVIVAVEGGDAEADGRESDAGSDVANAVEVKSTGQLEEGDAEVDELDSDAGSDDSDAVKSESNIPAKRIKREADDDSYIEIPSDDDAVEVVAVKRVRRDVIEVDSDDEPLAGKRGKRVKVKSAPERLIPAPVKSSSIRSLVKVRQLSDKDRKEIAIATGEVRADWMAQHPGKPWAALGEKLQGEMLQEIVERCPTLQRFDGPWPIRGFVKEGWNKHWPKHHDDSAQDNAPGPSRTPKGRSRRRSDAASSASASGLRSPLVRARGQSSASAVKPGGNVEEVRGFLSSLREDLSPLAESAMAVGLLSLARIKAVAQMGEDYARDLVDSIVGIDAVEAMFIVEGFRALRE